jgi:hypothetical protein
VPFCDLLQNQSSTPNITIFYSLLFSLILYNYFLNMSSNPPIPWTPFCGITGNSHENLVYCFHCHGRNPEVPYNTLTSARSRDIIEIDDAPSRSSISTTNQIAPRFGSYNRHGAEALRQSQPLRHNSVRRGSRGGPAADRSPTAYPAVVSFYMLHYQLSEGEDSEMIAEAISAQLLRTSFRASSLLFVLLIIE